MVPDLGEFSPAGKSGKKMVVLQEEEEGFWQQKWQLRTLLKKLQV